jgi:hypothetical protein
VLADILDEIISAEIACDVYGVVLTVDGRSVDYDATARRRRN